MTKKTTLLIILMFTVVTFSGCSTIDRSNYETKEEYVLTLIKECKVSPDIKFTELDNRYELTQVYLRNCKPETSPNAAIYVGINPYYRR
jgi:uncharacterized lipoprotein